MNLNIDNILKKKLMNKINLIFIYLMNGKIMIDIPKSDF